MGRKEQKEEWQERERDETEEERNVIRLNLAVEPALFG